MHRTGTKHIVRHMQKSVVQWSIISKFTCISNTNNNFHSILFFILFTIIKIKIFLYVRPFVCSCPYQMKLWLPRKSKDFSMNIQVFQAPFGKGDENYGLISCVDHPWHHLCRPEEPPIYPLESGIPRMISNTI